MCSTTTELFPLCIQPQLLNLAIKVSVFCMSLLFFASVWSGFILAMHHQVSSIFFSYNVPAWLPAIGKFEDWDCTKMPRGRIWRLSEQEDVFDSKIWPAASLVEKKKITSFENDQQFEKHLFLAVHLAASQRSLAWQGWNSIHHSSGPLSLFSSLSSGYLLILIFASIC